MKKILLLVLAACGHGPIRHVTLSPSIDVTRPAVLVCAFEPRKYLLTCLTPDEAAVALEPEKEQ